MDESGASNTNLIIILLVILIGFFIYVKQTGRQNGGQNNYNLETNDEVAEQFCSVNRCLKDSRNNSDIDDDFENDSIDSLLSLNSSERDLLYDRHSNSLCSRSQRSRWNKKRTNKRDAEMNLMFDSLQKGSRLKTELLDVLYHRDYNDTITAINNLTSQKELFNMGFLPVKETESDPKNVKQLVKLFMDRINDEVKHRVSEYLNINSGWNDQGKRKKNKSGFAEAMEELGLPGDLYAEPAGKSKLRLIKIINAEQMMTDDQIRFVVEIVVQKKNVKDQMVLKIHFFMERKDAEDGNDKREDFFSKSLANHYLETQDDEDLDPLVIIEQVFTVGFLSDAGNSKTTADKFYDYKDILNGDGIVDQYKVLQIMKKKHAERSKELSSFLCSTDADTQEIHDVPGIGDYESYKATRTIMDDLRIHPQNSF